jgi:hypothetical protein
MRRKETWCKCKQEIGFAAPSKLLLYLTPFVMPLFEEILFVTAHRSFQTLSDH